MFGNSRGMMGSMMANSMPGQATQGFSSPFGPFGGGGPINNPGGSATGDMKMKGGGMDVMGSMEAINRRQQDAITNPSGFNGNPAGGGMGLNNPIGGMLGSVFRVF